MMAPATGATFPDAPLRDLDGRAAEPARCWQDGPALVCVGHSDCGTTRLTLPFVDRIHRRRRPGTSVVALLQDEPAAALDLRRELQLELPVLLEADPYPVASALHLATVPTCLLLDERGTIIDVLEGYDRARLESLAERLGAGPLFAPGEQAPLFRPG
jgi:hypothetical protein